MYNLNSFYTISINFLFGFSRLATDFYFKPALQTVSEVCRPAVLLPASQRPPKVREEVSEDSIRRNRVLADGFQLQTHR